MQGGKTRAVLQLHYGQTSVMTGRDVHFCRRKRGGAGEAAVRVADLKAAIKWLLRMRLETSEVFC